MEPSCNFGLEYQPLQKTADPVLRTHLQNCSDCREQVWVVRST